MSKRFSGRLVLITGSAGGLGRVSALRFAQEVGGVLIGNLDELFQRLHDLIELVG